MLKVSQAVDFPFTEATSAVNSNFARRSNTILPDERVRSCSNMTRRSRTSAATTAKRAAPATIETTPTRQSKRVKTTAGASNGVSASPRKSKYFEGSEEPESSIGGEASGYEDDDASAVLTSDESEEGFDAEDSHEEAVGRSKRSAKKGGVVQVALARGKGKGSELWRPGVKTGLGPGQQVIVKKPKAREAGDVAYQEDTIHPNTMLFLGDLKRNNDRDWLKCRESTLASY